MLFRSTGRLAAATLLRDPSRTALSIATIAVGFGTVLWMWTLARSFERSVIEVMPGKLRGDLVVSLYNQPAVWAKLGYQGASAQYGGYINRGFNDQDWMNNI